MPGKNNITIIASPLVRQNQWHTPNQDPGAIKITTPAAPWQRSLFNGLAQLIIQSTGRSGDIIITAKAKGIKPASFIIKSGSTNISSALN